MILSQYWTQKGPIGGQSSPATGFAVAGAAVLICFTIAYRDYRAYVAMGPHGLPDTFQGWIKQLRMSKYARKDVTIPAPYHDAVEVARALGPNAIMSFLAEPLGSRTGPRPAIPAFVAPQRQTSDLAPIELKVLMNTHLECLAKANAALLKMDLSKLEGPVPALQLHEKFMTPSYLKPTRGELVHVHPPDGSTHLVLSLADSREVIEKGWGQRHRLSGGLLQWSYTLVYAPRNNDELTTWKRIVNAAVGFSTAEVGTLVKIGE